MNYLNILQLIGGLSFFLFGMQLLSDGLTSVSGGRLEQLLGKFCNTKPKGVLFGTVVTAAVQSSAATTVMVVALVNSGVLLLRQAVPVIMGANIGTTVTAWILSLTSISGDSILISLLKPSSFAPIVALIGVLMLLSAKTESKRFKAHSLLGFAILMHGMSIMTSALSPLQYEPAFIQMFEKLSNPFLGVLVGAVVTALLQSSTASLGILQALSSTGIIGFSSALPIVMGQNIGSCITVILASIGTSRNARRVAIIHLSFNTIGTIIFTGLFYLLHNIWNFPFMSSAVTPLMLAITHTTFNLLTTFLLLPFTEQLIKLSHAIIPVKDSELQELEEDDGLKLLDPGFLDRPAFALEQAVLVTHAMLGIAETGMNMSLDLLDNYNEEVYHRVEKLEKQADEYEDALSDYLVRISSGSLNEQSGQMLTILMHAINDIERISDHSINLSDLARDNMGMIREFSGEAKEELRLYSKAVREIMALTFDAFENLNPDLAFSIEPLEDRIDELNKQFTSNHIERLKDGSCSIDHGFVLTEAYNVLERVADHCSNIGIYIIQYDLDQNLRVHDYAHTLDRSESDYAKLYREYAEKYPLPDGSGNNIKKALSGRRPE